MEEHSGIKKLLKKREEITFRFADGEKVCVSPLVARCIIIVRFVNEN